MDKRDGTHIQVSEKSWLLFCFLRQDTGSFTDKHCSKQLGQKKYISQAVTYTLVCEHVDGAGSGMCILIPWRQRATVLAHMVNLVKLNNGKNPDGICTGAKEKLVATLSGLFSLGFRGLTVSSWVLKLSTFY